MVALQGGFSMSTLARKTDAKVRLTLPSDFANCLVTVERVGDELRVRKARRVSVRRYTFKELMAKVTAKNIHPPIDTGRPVGGEVL
jgi:hypothetical protein